MTNHGLVLVEVPGRVRSSARVAESLAFMPDGRTAVLRLPSQQCSNGTANNSMPTEGNAHSAANTLQTVQVNGQVLPTHALLIDTAHGRVVGEIHTAVRFRALADFVVPHDPGVLGDMHSRDAPDIAAIAEAAHRQVTPADATLPHLPRISSAAYPFIRAIPDSAYDTLRAPSESVSPVAPLADDLDTQDALGGALATPLRGSALLFPRQTGRKSFGAASTPWSRAYGEAPCDAPDAKRLALAREKHAAVLEQLAELFAQRPLWLRQALKSHLTEDDYECCSSVLPAVAYYVLDGPWRACWARIGYYALDPQHASEAARLQIIDLRGYRSSAPGEPPLGKNGLAQLCDVAAQFPAAGRILEKAVLRQAPSKAEGWLHAATTKAVRKAVRKHRVQRLDKSDKVAEAHSLHAQEADLAIGDDDDAFEIYEAD